MPIRLSHFFLRTSLEFPIAEPADFGVGFDGFGAVRAFAGTCRIAESAFLEGALMIFNDLLDALRIPLCVAVAVDLVGPAGRFDPDIRPENSRFDADRRDVPDVDGFFV